MNRDLLRGFLRVSLRLTSAAVFVGLVALVEASPAQTVTPLYSFDGSNSSQFPFATLAQGRDSKLYGTTSGLTFGSVFSTTTAGSTTELFALNGTDGSNPARA